MRIRQIALVAADLESALSSLTESLAIEVAFRDPGVGVFGLANGVMPIGEQFLEVVSPKQENTAAGRYLERRRRPGGGADAGDGGYMVILQTRELEDDRRRLTDEGVRVVWEIALDDIATIHLHPRDTGGAIVSMDQADPWESWRWAGPKWRDHVATSRVTGIAGVEIQSDDPDALADRWSRMFNIPRTAEARILSLEGAQWISFCEIADERGEGIRSVAIHARDRDAIRRTATQRNLEMDDDAVTICGTRFVLI